MMNRRRQTSNANVNNNGISLSTTTTTNGGGNSTTTSSSSSKPTSTMATTTATPTKRRSLVVPLTMILLFVILCGVSFSNNHNDNNSEPSSSSVTTPDKKTRNTRQKVVKKETTATDKTKLTENMKKQSLKSPTRSTRKSTINTNSEKIKCGIDHFDLNSKEAIVGSAGSKGPVIVRGWRNSNDEYSKSQSSWEEDAFVTNYGNYMQYIKDGTVQPFQKQSNAQAANKNDDNKPQCRLPGSEIIKLMKDKTKKDVLFFTNNKENPEFMKELSKEYQVPDFLSHINKDGSGFEVLSAMTIGKSHTFHKHGESWIGQVEGRKMWWFLPPTTTPKPNRTNACHYLDPTKNVQPPPGSLSCIQEPGDIIWFPKDWYHATCALDDWNIAIGAQQGPLIRQAFDVLDQDQHKVMTQEQIQTEIKECRLDNTGMSADDGWTWFGGNLNEYYNSLEKDHKRNPNKISDYAVHRWLGDKRSTEVHYELLNTAVATYHGSDTSTDKLNVLDGGCGLGSALMWMEQTNPQWDLTGHTISDEQYKFITEKLPPHKFKVNLRSYDQLDDPNNNNNNQKNMYDFIYSIEALIHTPDLSKTLKEWSDHLSEGGVIAIIDDFLSVGTSKDDEEVVAFSKSWLANVLVTPTEMGKISQKFGLHVVENRDLDAEYRINEINYRNKMPDIKPDRGRSHQGWMGSKWRQRLMLEGKLTYNLLVLQKGGKTAKTSSSTTTSKNTNDNNDDSKECATVPSKKSGDILSAQFNEITPELMTGKGKSGGNKMACISSWYCCNKGTEWYDKLDANRTDNTAYLKLSRDLFGHYVDSFAKHLNEHYKTYPEGATGRFLDIGGTGSTASGMAQVTSKFQHFAGPLEYWILDSDPGAKTLERTLYCDIDDCPQAESCAFDVTFSHTVLEHAQRPWKSFDTVARLTKKGGLTMHLVPFSYQYHATPDDNYRFSHKALTTLLEDRGFTVLEVGYDICTKPQNMLRRVDEHYDTIWLTYVIGRKN